MFNNAKLLINAVLHTSEVLGELLVNHSGQVTTIIQDHVQGLSSSESGNGLFNTPLVFSLGLSLPCEDRDTGGSDTV